MISEMFWNRLFKPFDYTLHAALISDIGKKRVENQDNFCFDTFINVNKAKSVRLKSQNFALPGAYAIMDGMGGEKLGAQASLEAAGFFSNIKKNILELLQRLNADERERVFYSLIHSMNEKVCQMAIKNHVKQSGTTFCAVFLIENRAYIVSVGDSKIFLIRNGKAVWQNESDAINTAIVENGRKKWIKLFFGSEWTQKKITQKNIYSNYKITIILNQYIWIIREVIVPFVYQLKWVAEWGVIFVLQQNKLLFADLLQQKYYFRFMK